MTTLSEFRLWLQQKYGTVARLSSAWRRPTASFDDVPCPETLSCERKENLPPHLDWLEFEESRTTHTDWLSRLERVPIGVPDDADPGALYECVRSAARVQCLAGDRPTAADLCRRFAAKGDPATREFVARAAMMHGASAAALPEGELSDDLLVLAEALRRVPWELDRKILVLYPRIYARLQRLAEREQRTTPGAAQATFGLERAIQVEGPALFRKIVGLVARARFSFALGDTDLPPDQISIFPLVICPTLELLSADAMRKLEAYVQAGGFLALGPRIPLLDQTMRSNDTLARHFGEGLSEFAQELRPVGQGGFLTLPGFMSAATIEFLAFESGLAKALMADAPPLDSSVHRAGRRRLLFVANCLDASVETPFYGEPFGELRPIGGSASHRVLRNSGAVVPPRAILAFDVL